MTLYLNFRSQSVGGSVAGPYVLKGNGTASPPALQLADPASLGPMIEGKNILFGVHGFNVSLKKGADSLGQLEPHLRLGPSDIFFGVLWPGDFWLPVVNYPFEGADAMECGKRLADFCRVWLTRAQSFSFVSHSLGARLVLEAVKHLDRPARSVCLTAPAIDRDCLSTEYAQSNDNAAAISILASRSDWVLKVAFRIGDPISDLLQSDYASSQRALGYAGPPVPALPPIVPPWQISKNDEFGHGDYLPPGDAGKWQLSAEFMARAFRGQPQNWP